MTAAAQQRVVSITSLFRWTQINLQMKGGHHVGKLEVTLNAAQIGLLPTVAGSRRGCRGGSVLGHQCVKLLPSVRNCLRQGRSAPMNVSIALHVARGHRFARSQRSR